ncbi:MAG TPA: LbtU family siderophore porin [Desulfobacterales bacterium]|nr:LbtU family siderophore porin [Desulfobacterales bacterium]
MKKMTLLLSCLILVCVQASPIMAQDSMSSEQAEQTNKVGGVKSLEDRIKHLEDAIKRKPESDKWYDRIEISGLVEVEAGYEKTDFKDLAIEDKKNSDVDLATAELVVHAKIAEHVEGHVMFKYEDDDLFVDEGFIALVGSESFPAYLIAGRQYIPFGNYDSHFVTDPNTLILGETNEGAVVAGYRFGGEMVDVSVGAFNGNAKEIGKDDVIDSFVGSIAVNPFENMMFGASYTSNLAGSDTFNTVVVDPDNLDSLVGGWSAFVSFKFLERFKLIGEYVGALDSFKAGEIYDAADTKERKPSAWNVELGVAIIDNLELAVRYDGSDEGGADFLPESQYGAVLNWGFFKNTNLAIEYLHGEFEDDAQETDSFIAQLAIKF